MNTDSGYIVREIGWKTTTVYNAINKKYERQIHFVTTKLQAFCVKYYSVGLFSGSLSETEEEIDIALPSCILYYGVKTVVSFPYREEYSWVSTAQPTEG